MSHDISLELASAQVEAVLRGEVRAPHVKAFFDERTFTASYVVQDPASRRAAIIDSVLDFDPAAGRTSFESAEAMIAYVEAEGLKVEWLLETHAHADSRSAPRSSRCRKCSARSSTKAPASPAMAPSSTGSSMTATR